MSNDRYENIRKALAMRPTPGPWELKDGRTDTVENAQGYPVCTVHWHPDERYGHGVRAAYIAACDPDTIRDLLAERDRLAAENARLREAAKSARDALAVAIKAAWEDSTDADVAEHVVIKKLDAAIDAALAKENSDARAELAKAEGR